MGVLTLAIAAVPDIFVRLFLNNPDAIAQTAVFARRYCIGFAFVAIQFSFVDGFTAMGMAKEAIPISDCVGSIFTLVMYLLILKKRLARVMCQSH